MTAPSLAQPWVLIDNGKAPPALAYLTRRSLSDKGFVCDLMVVEMDQIRGTLQWRKRFEYSERMITDDDILHIFPSKPGPNRVAEVRRALRRKQQNSAPVQGSETGGNHAV